MGAHWPSSDLAVPPRAIRGYCHPPRLGQLPAVGVPEWRGWLVKVGWCPPPFPSWAVGLQTGEMASQGPTPNLVQRPLPEPEAPGKPLGCLPQALSQGLLPALPPLPECGLHAFGLSHLPDMGCGGMSLSHLLTHPGPGRHCHGPRSLPLPVDSHLHHAVHPPKLLAPPPGLSLCSCRAPTG